MKSEVTDTPIIGLSRLGYPFIRTLNSFVSPKLTFLVTDPIISFQILIGNLVFELFRRGREL